MHRQNRVDPFGVFHALPARGQLMGNRGILHDADMCVVRTHAHRNWVTCALSFRDRRRKIMAEGRYTELFFLDEATAFAAGHRPCAECRRDRYRAFADAWVNVHGREHPDRSLPQEIDRMLHAARIDREGRKVTFPADVRDLPDGVLVAAKDRAVLIHRGVQLDWTFGGYSGRAISLQGIVTVLTPRPVVDVFRSGFRPMLHGSAG